MASSAQTLFWEHAAHNKQLTKQKAAYRRIVPRSHPMQCRRDLTKKLRLSAGVRPR